VKVFISSVRHGLEEERDALPGMIQALGHEPRRFEDYSAQSVPSRQACLDGVEDADAYVLLLGQHYGDLLPDTGKSPTEEEFTVAKRRGIPMASNRAGGHSPKPSRDSIARNGGRRGEEPVASDPRQGEGSPDDFEGRWVDCRLTVAPDGRRSADQTMRTQRVVRTRSSLRGLAITGGSIRDLGASPDPLHRTGEGSPVTIASR
jgi:hypothetical protein